MWEYNSEYNKWNMSIDNMIDDDYQFYLQELSLVRFYSKALSGATYLPVSNFNNIYDVLGSYKARNWYIGVDGSEYAVPNPAADQDKALIKGVTLNPKATA